MGQPFVSTRDAAARLAMSTSATSQLLRRLTQDRLVAPVRRGLWALDANPDPLQLAGWITAPYPSYVSLWSALYAHRLLSQVPRDTYLVSLGRPRRIATRLGSIIVHQIAPRVFGGFATDQGISLASPTKAVFDFVYLSATHGVRFRHFPELNLARAYRAKEARQWAAKIPSSRVRSIVAERLAGIESDGRKSPERPWRASI